MTRYFLTPDLHGDARLAEGLLKAAGVPTSTRARAKEGIQSVQLGDLANCVAADANRDVRILERAREWFDVVLVGNHEYPYFGGPRFRGFFNLGEVKDRIRDLEKLLRIRPCLLVGDVLVTHAGVAGSWGYTEAWEAAGAIEEAWRSDKARHPLLAAIGRSRGGSSPEGGILWSDFHETRAPFRQVHGHTPMGEGPWLRDAAGKSLVEGPLEVWEGSVNLDVGGKFGGALVGAWLAPGGRLEFVRVAP